MTSGKTSVKKAALMALSQSAILGLISLMLLVSCHNNPDIKAPEAVKDSVSNGGGGSIGKDSNGLTSAAKKHTDTITADIHTNHGTKKDSVRKILRKLEDSIGKKNATLSQVPAKDNTVVQKTESAPAAISPKPAETQAAPDANDKFVSKYGVIPRNTTESNINSFLEAFPDKSILVKVNFDGTADTEMNGVRNQIIKVLKNLGYNNIAPQPASLEPIRMPKEIHYELQRNGSVIVWIPISNSNQ